MSNTNNNKQYYACDCREQQFAEMAAENRSMRKQLQYANGKLSEVMIKMDELRDIICRANATGDPPNPQKGRNEI
jgi:hypothetical protein